MCSENLIISRIKYESQILPYLTTDYHRLNNGQSSCGNSNDNTLKKSAKDFRRKEIKKSAHKFLKKCLKWKHKKQERKKMLFLLKDMVN